MHVGVPTPGQHLFNSSTCVLTQSLDQTLFFFSLSQFSDENITFLAKYDMVILCHGYWDSSGTLVPAEVAMADAARRLRAARSSVNIIF